MRVGGGVTSRVLVLNLPAAGNGATARLLAMAAAAGAPLRLTLRDLVDAAPTWDPGRAPRVHVCENPAVLAAAADEHGRPGRAIDQEAVIDELLSDLGLGGSSRRPKVR